MQRDKLDKKNFPKEGEAAPNFRFEDKKGVKKALSDLQGKQVAVYFYPRDFTPGCTIEADEFAQDYEKYKEKNIEIIGISPDDEESHKKFREKMNIAFFLASDINNEISNSYGVYVLKKFMGKEYMGISRTTFIIDEKGIIRKIFPNVKPKGHSLEVLKYFSSNK
jgi:peroxiredoxin Q/BCP